MIVVLLRREKALRQPIETANPRFNYDIEIMR